MALPRLPPRVQGDDRGLGRGLPGGGDRSGIIVESTSTGNALVLSRVMPFAVAGVLAVWNVAYARRSRRAGELLGAAAHARGEVRPPMPS